MKVFLSYSTNSHYEAYRKNFAKFLVETNHSLVTADYQDPIIPLFEKEKVEVIPNVDTISFETNFKSLFSSFIKSDLLVFFPGGLNTVWELSSILHHAYYAKINKPIIIVNLNGFFDDFINTIKVSLREEPAFKADSNWYYIANNLFEAQEFIKEFSKFNSLSSVVNYGDYVDYPVKYDNVILPNGQHSCYKGWRVININQNYVQLISAGTPLSISYEKNEGSQNFVKRLNSFNEFCDSGFDENVNDVFFNRYTLYHEILSYEDVQFISKDSMCYNGTDVYLISTGSHGFFLMRNNRTIDIAPHGIYGVRIVVTLKSDTMTTGKNKDGVWMLA